MKQIYESIRTNGISPTSTSNSTSALSFYHTYPPPPPPSQTTTITSTTTTKNYDEHYKFDVIMFGKNDDMSKFNDEIEKVMKNNKEMIKLKLSSYISEKRLLCLTNDWRIRLNCISRSSSNGSRSADQSNRRSRIINNLLLSLSIMPELSDNLIEYKHIPKMQDIHGKW
jgi:hypothetical protein